MNIKLCVNSELDLTKEELYNSTLQLKDELSEIDLDNIEFQKSNQMAKGAKSGNAVLINEILLTLAASGGVLTTLINVLHSWLIRNREHSITLEIDGDKLEVKGASAKEKKQLIDEWLKNKTTTE